MNLTFVKEEGYLIVGREGRLAAALLKNASRQLNKELVFNISARNLEIEFIDNENSVIAVKGSVPGRNGSDLIVKLSNY